MRETFFQPRGHAHGRRVGALLLGLLVFASLPGPASADCKFIGGTSASVVSFNPPSRITVPNTAFSTETELWVSPPVYPVPVPRLNCRETTNTGVVNTIGAQTTGTDFPTNITGLVYRLTYGDTTTRLNGYQAGPRLLKGQPNLNIPTYLHLVATGPIANGNVLGGGPIGHWDVVGAGRVANFTLLNSVTFVAPACTVTTNPTIVTLPPVPATAFSGNGSAAGMTPFAIQLNCSGATLSVTLDTNSPVASAPGVIASNTGAGFAKGVGVQVLDNNTNAVTFGQPASVGATPNGPLAVAYFARYYQTGPVTAGQVAATATFTLSYP